MIIYGGLLNWGYLCSSSILDWDFPWNKPSSELGVPPWLWKSPYCNDPLGVPAIYHRWPTLARLSTTLGHLGLRVRLGSGVLFHLSSSAKQLKTKLKSGRGTWPSSNSRFFWTIWVIHSYMVNLCPPNKTCWWCFHVSIYPLVNIQKTIENGLL